MRATKVTIARDRRQSGDDKRFSARSAKYSPLRHYAVGRFHPFDRIRSPAHVRTRVTAGEREVRTLRAHRSIRAYNNNTTHKATLFRSVLSACSLPAFLFRPAFAVIALSRSIRVVQSRTRGPVPYPSVPRVQCERTLRIIKENKTSFRSVCPGECSSLFIFHCR